MKRTIVPIKGMHCRSCELLVEGKLGELEEIKKIEVSYRKSQAVVYSKHPLKFSRVRTKIEEAGYELGVEEKKSWISHDPQEYVVLAKSLVLLLVLYFIAKSFGLFNINAGSASNPSSLLVVLLIGLTAGLSTCMAMVGGLILGISARHAEKHPEASAFQKFRPHLYFNLGRISSYFLLGGLIGLLGKAFQLSGTVLGILTIFVGLVMLTLGAQLTQMFPRLSSGGFTLPSGISRFLGIKKHHEKEYSHLNSVLVGALTFFMPCGFTQAMQLFAMSTGNFWSGAMIMGVFALGTVPGLLGIGGLTSVIKGAFANKFFKFAGLVVIFLAIFNISNGYRLTGWKNIFASATIQPSSVQSDPNVKIENGFQVVSMTQLTSGYKPNKFTIKAGIPVKWQIDSQGSGSCASSIVMPAMNVRKFLSPGANTIEFTPTQEGQIRFTCSMGMYSGTFNVVKNDQPISQSPQASVSSSPIPQPSPTTQANISQVQVIKTTYNSPSTDIDPKTFNVKAGQPVRLELDVKADGQGCMGSFMIPGLVNEPSFLQKGQNLTFDFTPLKGTYNITCAMGVPRGQIIAV